MIGILDDKANKTTQNHYYNDKSTRKKDNQNANYFSVHSSLYHKSKILTISIQWLAWCHRTWSRLHTGTLTTIWPAADFPLPRKLLPSQGAPDSKRYIFNSLESGPWEKFTHSNLFIDIYFVIFASSAAASTESRQRWIELLHFRPSRIPLWVLTSSPSLSIWTLSTFSAFPSLVKVTRYIANCDKK